MLFNDHRKRYSVVMDTIVGDLPVPVVPLGGEETGDLCTATKAIVYYRTQHPASDYALVEWTPRRVPEKEVQECVSHCMQTDEKQT